MGYPPWFGTVTVRGKCSAKQLYLTVSNNAAEAPV